MARGASVFKNTGCDGKTDLCFKYKGQIHEIDVKLACYTEGRKGSFSWKSKKASEVKLPVYPLIVIPLTGTDLSGWYCRWRGLKGGRNAAPLCPPGLENFWS